MGIKYVFNPTTGNLDATSVELPAGSTTQIQFNDAGAFGGDADLTWNKTTNVLGVAGDVTLNDGGSFTTTVQTVTPTANRTISFPDATGTVGLVAGSSGQLTWNNAGAYAGASTLTYDGSILTTSGRFINSYNAAASAPAKAFTGTWFTGGTSTTTKPHFLIEPTGATSTAWSTSGTGLGVNAASGFTGRLLDLQLNGTSNFNVDSTGRVSFPLATAALPALYPGTDTNTGIWSPAADTYAVSTNGTEAYRVTSAQRVGIGTTSPARRLHVEIPDGPVARLRTTNNPDILELSGNTTTTAPILGAVAESFTVKTNGSERFRVTGGGLVSFGGGESSSFPALKRNGTVLETRLADDTGFATTSAQLRAQGTAPANATATGTAGDIRYDADYIYVCTATNTWKRAALSTWP